MSRILIIEDEAALASAIGQLTRRMGFEPLLAASAAQGLEQLRRRRPDLVVLDIGLPDRSGLEVLQEIRSIDADLPVLIITAHGHLQNAVEAKKRGASGYLVKPLDLRELEKSLQVLLQSQGDGAVAAAVPDASSDSALLIGSAPAMQPAFAAIAHATTSDAPVLITGPTGIGKSLAARVIHLHSRRHAGPFVTLSCASLPENLLESEVFGHEKGAFTGALATKAGHIERAAGGTLFLDEIGELSPALQVKLLRFVEEKVFSRVGGREDLKVDLRIIAATNQDLAQAAAEKRFREDLLYRLRVLEVHLPPLRERLSDIPGLCSYLLASVAGDRKLAVSEEALSVLLRHDWPGNVRELRNVIEHAAAVCTGPLILPTHLPRDVVSSPAGETSGFISGLDAALHEWIEARLREGMKYDALHEELESRLLAALLPRFENKPTVLAREMDMNRATLRKKLRDPSSMEEN
ncbi:sigma-54-dependent transcriptional regulator [Verrucomicrobium spinosum]|uniref:sigma-54-dependent transcriptional regulator n=2 Tax=Verrucomicrobium spinosum TaxID=2736 RepID=UPI000174558D|nr:sigma-54 dependent transcriptional regulator [Verrucomicrobium spinosum]